MNLLPWYYYLAIVYAEIALVNMIVRRWKKSRKDVKIFMSTYLISVHAIAFTLSFYRLYELPKSWPIFIEAIIWYSVTGMLGITAGCHRLWSHRSYKARLPARIIMMIANSIANQGSIIHWSRLHRAHHRASDTDADPHSSKKGFFYSHMGWLLFQKTEEQRKEIAVQNVEDLYEDPVCALQHKCDPWWNNFWCFVFPSIYGHFMYGSAISGFLILGVLRYLMLLHATWCVNSFAHFIGYQPYNPNIPPRESFLTTIAAVGEGWHNFHHVYPYDYSASEHGWIKCWNPTTLWIDTLWLIGQAYDCRKVGQVRKYPQNDRKVMDMPKVQ